MIQSMAPRRRDAPRWVPVGWRVAWAAVLVCGLAGCNGGGPGLQRDNLRPHVRLTAGPAAGDSARYNATFRWYGWDDDGVIDRYQYAIDIPARFTLAEIDSPGPNGIAWRDTLGTEAAFLFTVATPETLRSPDGNDYPTSRPYGPHTLYLRAVDNDGGVSPAAAVSFTAYTILPQSFIDGAPRVAHVAENDVPVVDFSVRWKGVDLDRNDTPREPVAYEWKLIRLGSVTEAVVPDALIHGAIGVSFPWHRVDGGINYMATRLPEGVAYLFALRALDEAGGLEDTFVLGRNALVLEAVGRPGGPPVSPVLTINEAGFGSFTFPADGDSVRLEGLVGRCPRFDFSGDASAYRGVMAGYRWCFDREEGAPECAWDREASGWRGWGAPPFQGSEPFCVQVPGVHRLLLGARDAQGNTTTAHLVMIFLAFPHDRDVLYVDDFRGSLPGDGPGLGDAAMDARFVAALHTAGFARVDVHDVWGAGDVTGVPHPPSLAMLSHYRLVFWSTNGDGGGLAPGVSGLLSAGGCGRDQVLRAYLASGGALCLSGVGVVGALAPEAGSDGMCRAADNTGVAGLTPPDANFLCTFLHQCGTRFRRAAPAAAGDVLQTAHATVAAGQAGFPTVALDSALRSDARGGLSGYDAALEASACPNCGVLDTLYTAGVAAADSPFAGKPIAWRWSAMPQSVDGGRGPVALFTFPLEALAIRGSASAGTSGDDLETLLSVLAAWFRAQGILNA